MRTAVANINGEIAKAVIGKELNQAALDEAMIALDGTANKGRLGANATLARVDGRRCARPPPRSGVPLFEYIGALRHAMVGGARADLLPVPMCNILNGGAHADTNVDFQEFMVMPVGASSFSEALRGGAEIFHALRGILKKRGLATGVGDEGGFAPNLKSNQDALDVVMEAIGKAGFKAGTDVVLALDVAASEFFEDGQYVFKKSGDRTRSSRRDDRALHRVDARATRSCSIEDGLSEADWPGWERLTKALGANVQLVGDDVFVTNPVILKEGIARGIANSLLVKVNQIGTVTETLQAMADGVGRRLHDDRVAPLRRDRGFDDCRPRGRHARRPDQDRLAVPQRSRGQVQPAAPHRGSARLERQVRGPRRPQAVEVSR